VTVDSFLIIQFKMTRNAIASLIPVRFLTIIAHLALTISLFWTKDANLRLCLPTGYTQAQYTQKDLHALPAFVEICVIFAVSVLKAR
ncbi:Transmembrane protein 107, partial [Trichoplax sp. H2]